MNNCQVEYTPPSPEEESAIVELLKELIYNQKELINNQNEGFSSLESLLNQLITLTGPSQPPIDRYFSTEETAISIATPNKPEGPDTIANAATGTTGYDRIRIYDIMGRNSPNISVINDGTTSLFVIISHDGQIWSSDENPILVGEARLFHNAHELRIRSPTAGNLSNFTGGVYRATEYDYWLAYSSAVSSGAINRSTFTAQSLIGIGAPGVGTNLPNITVPNGFQLVVRATIGNVANVFLANSAANTGIAANRITLAAGDTAKLQITNANLVWVASTGVANVDILAEQ